MSVRESIAENIVTTLKAVHSPLRLSYVTRQPFALDTQITQVEIDEGQIDPIGGVILTVRVMYQYTRGTT